MKVLLNEKIAISTVTRPTGNKNILSLSIYLKETTVKKKATKEKPASSIYK